MTRSSGALGTSLSGLASLSVLPDRRRPNVIAPLGDSRVAAIYADTPVNRRYCADSPLVWARALLGQRFIIGDSWGVAGDRTDQMLARLAPAIASGAGILYLQGGLNDIAQQYPSATTSGEAAAANLITMADAARQAGMTVVIEAEVGADTINNGAMIAQLVELNARLAAYAEATPGIWLNDARGVYLVGAASGNGVQIAPALTYDGTHPAMRGAMLWGQKLAVLLDRLIPPGKLLPIVNALELPANGRRQLLDNPVFANGSGGTVTGGATGTVPASWQAQMAGAASAASVAVGADADGIGNNVTATVTFAGPGVGFWLVQGVAGGAYQVGDIVEGYAEVAINGTPSGLAGVDLQVEHFLGSGVGQSDEISDMYPPQDAAHAGPDRAVALTLRTRPYAVAAESGTGAYLALYVRVLASGSGSASITIRRAGLIRRDAAY